MAEMLRDHSVHHTTRESHPRPCTGKSDVTPTPQGRATLAHAQARATSHPAPGQVVISPLWSFRGTPGSEVNCGQVCILELVNHSVSAQRAELRWRSGRPLSTLCRETNSRSKPSPIHGSKVERATSGFIKLWLPGSGEDEPGQMLIGGITAGLQSGLH